MVVWTSCVIHFPRGSKTRVHAEANTAVESARPRTVLSQPQHISFTVRTWEICQTHNSGRGFERSLKRPQGPTLCKEGTCARVASIRTRKVQIPTTTARGHPANECECDGHSVLGIIRLPKHVVVCRVERSPISHKTPFAHMPLWICRLKTIIDDPQMKKKPRCEA